MSFLFVRTVKYMRCELESPDQTTTERGISIRGFLFYEREIGGRLSMCSQRAPE